MLGTPAQSKHESASKSAMFCGAIGIAFVRSVRGDSNQPSIMNISATLHRKVANDTLPAHTWNRDERASGSLGEIQLGFNIRSTLKAVQKP
jgi:hypothetical protein